MPRTVGVRAPRRYATTSLGGNSARSPPMLIVSTALDGTDGCRPTRKYTAASPTKETNTAIPSRVRMIASPRLAIPVLSVLAARCLRASCAVLGADILELLSRQRSSPLAEVAERQTR